MFCRKKLCLREVGTLSQLRVGYLKTIGNHLETNETDRQTDRQTQSICFLVSESQNQNLNCVNSFILRLITDKLTRVKFKIVKMK